MEAQKIQKVKEKALVLYKQGLTTREVGKIIGRSHQWVALRVKNLSTPKSIDKELQGAIIKKRLKK